MSYCRWSCDDFKSDLYCYEDVSGGWTTHVAARRVIGDVPSWSWKDTPEKMAAAMKARQECLATASYEPMGLPHDGETFNDQTLKDFKARLLSLRELGYHVTEHALLMVDQEIAEQVGEQAHGQASPQSAGGGASGLS
jgi:hypothetical protein